MIFVDGLDIQRILTKRCLREIKYVPCRRWARKIIADPLPDYCTTSEATRTFVFLVMS